jgi:hypothetical protein
VLSVELGNKTLALGKIAVGPVVAVPVAEDPGAVSEKLVPKVAEFCEATETVIVGLEIVTGACPGKRFEARLIAS